MKIQNEDNFDDGDCSSRRSVSYCLRATGTAKASPIVPRGHDCIEYAEGGTDCSFTTYAQCEATASGLAAECYRSAVSDDEQLRWQFPRVGQHEHHLRF